jgi:Fe-S-cluster containining protein
MSAYGACTSCDGRCCRYYLVLVSGHDIAAISDATGLSPQRFVVMCRDDELPFEPPGGAGTRLVADGPNMTVPLDQHYDSPDRHRCVFLMELPDGRARCAVYPHRPAACAAFPFAVNEGVAFVRDGVMCGPGSWRIAGNDLQSRRVNVARAEFEWRLHRLGVVHWNQHVDSRKPRVFSRAELFDYILGADHRIDQLRSAYSDEEFAQLITAACDDDSEASTGSGFLADVAQALTAGMQRRD